jgi:hypothetical protein
MPTSDGKPRGHTDLRGTSVDVPLHHAPHPLRAEEGE